MAEQITALRLTVEGHATPLAYGLAVAIVVISTLIGLPLRTLTDSDNLTMIYMTGVVIAAARLGVGPSVLASTLSVAAFNFFFTRPYYTFQFYDPHYYLTFAVMLVTSLLVGSLTARVSRHAQQSQAKAQETQILYDLTRRLSSVRGADNMALAASAAISVPYAVTVRLWAQGPDGLHPIPAGAVFNDEAAETTLTLPLLSHGEIMGEMHLTPIDGVRTFTAAETMQFETFATLIASALQRVRQAETAERASIESENEKLRNVLLSSLSHDLRTPLTVMNGGLSTLLKMRKKLPREAVDELTGLWGQLDGLQKFVNNLLRMAALTSGRMKLNAEPYLIQEIIGAAIGRVQSQKGERTLRTLMTGTLPMVMIDGALVEQVLVNLLENAIRYTPDGGVITLAAEKDGGYVRVSVSDSGPGLPAGEEAHIFEQFHTNEGLGSDRHESKHHGTGLGLAICRGIVLAHGGQISAQTLRAEGRATGASFTFTLPKAQTQ